MNTIMEVVVDTERHLHRVLAEILMEQVPLGEDREVMDMGRVRSIREGRLIMEDRPIRHIDHQLCRQLRQETGMIEMRCGQCSEVWTRMVSGRDSCSSRVVRLDDEPAVVEERCVEEQVVEAE
jgi:hypothetical protein